MTSVLAQQLAQLAEVRGDATARRTRGKPSLLFDYQTAADVDVQTIYNISLQGLDQLSSIDSRFHPFSNTLFSRASLAVNREQVTKEEEAKINLQIASFMRILSNHFLSPACFKVLEYLIRRYRVNELNVDDLMAAALPFHSTNEFVRVIQTARLDHTIWQWLSKMQDSGAALPRDILVKRCGNDRTVLSFICESAKQHGTTKQLSRTWLSFYAVVVCEVISGLRVVPDDLVALLLPFLTSGLASDASQDYRAASLMIITQICSKCSLSKEFLSAIICSACKNTTEADVRTVLMVLAHIAMSQPQLKQLSGKATKAVQGLPRIAEHLASLSQSGCQLQPLLALLLRNLAFKAAAEEQTAKVLADVVAAVSLDAQAEGLAEKLLAAVEGLASEDSDSRRRLQSVLKALEIRYPTNVDAAVNKALSKAASSSKQQHQQLVAFIADAFHGSSHTPVAEDPTMTIATAVDAPAAQLRCAALAALDDLCQKSDPEQSSVKLLEAAVERRLVDDSLAVVAAVLRMKSLRRLRAGQLAAGIGRLLARLEQRLLDSSVGKEEGSSIRQLLQQAFAQLGAVAGRDAGLADEVISHVCSFVFGTGKRGRKVADAALKAAAELQHPLAASFAAAGAAAGEEVVVAVVQQLSLAAQKNAAVVAKLGELLTSSSSSAKCKVLMLLALQHVAVNSSQHVQQALAALVAAAESSLSSSSAVAGLASWQQQAQQYLDSSSLPTKQLITAVQQQAPQLQQVLLLQALHTCLAAAPAAALQSIFGSASACFTRLAQLQPAEAVAELLQMAMGKLAGAQLVSTLCSIAAAPSGYTAEVQSRALAALPVAVSSSSEAAAQVPSQLPLLLAALGSSDSSIRSAALACISKLAATVTTAAPLPQLFKALAAQAELIRANPAAATAAVNATIKATGSKKAAELAAATSALLQQELPRLAGPAGMAAADAVLSCLLDALPALDVLTKGLPLLVNAVTDLAAGSCSKQQAAVAARLAALFSPEAVAASAELAAAYFSILSTTQTAAAAAAEDLAAVRAAALQCCSPELFAALQKEQQATALKLLLEASAADPSQQCRAAARSSLEQLPIAAATLIPLLSLTSSSAAAAAAPAAEPAPAKKKTRRGAKAAAAAAPAPAADATPAEANSRALDTAVAALELLQWKSDISGTDTLLQPLQSLLQQLLPIMDSVAVAHNEEEEETAAEQQQQQGKSSTAGYAAQLALTYLQGMAQQQLQPGKGAGQFDMALVVRLAQQAPDSAVRNAALSLLALLASVAPQDALEHVLQVLALVHQTSAMYSDSYSAQVATTALTAVVPAWLAAGRDPAELFRSVTQSLGSVPAHRRLPLLSTMVSAMSAETALPIALLLLLQQTAAQPKKQEQQQQQEGDAGWAEDLAAALCLQVGPEVLLPALASVMQRSAELEAPHQVLPRIVVAFVTAQLKLKSIQKAGSTEAAESAAALQPGCQSIMAQALQQLQHLNITQLKAAAGHKAAKAARAATQGLYDIFKALEGLLDVGSYLAATLQLAQHEQDKVRRRALKLFSERLASLKASLEADADLPARVREQRISDAAESALGVCQLLPGFLAKGSEDSSSAAASPMTRQAALFALDSVARMFSAAAAQQVLASLPSVLAATADESSAAVRASALACTAAIIKALGPKLVAQLPATAEAVLAATDRAQQQLSSSTAAAAASSEEDEDMEPAAATAATAAEEVALELSSALAAVDALVQSLGAFCSPYLPRILQNLLQPNVLSCAAANCSTFAAHIRSSLPPAIPARLLLQPLFAQWDHVVAVAAADVEPAVALLGMVAATANHMDSKAAAAYHEQLFGFLLKALDLRQQRLLPAGDTAAGSAAVQRVEAAAVQALVALVMKLSEARFKPLFLRMLEWAGAAGTSSSSASSSTGRVATLLACADALTARLRSVMVPYFKYLLDVCVAQLSGQESQQQPKKKRKKQQAAAAEGAAAADAESQLTSWLARMRALRALHRCLLHDSVDFLDREKFDCILPAFVAQLDSEPPAPLLPILSSQCADADLDSSITLGSRTTLDVLHTAAVAALTQLAITANSDAMWKPLNHQVLMVTRSGRAASRLAGLEVVAQLVGQLHEEYLMLLPETIPFLAELVEDSEAVVEARAQEVVKMLEGVSGEKLDQYMK